MSAKHTPGPWSHNTETGEIFYADGDVQPLIATVSCENAQTHEQYLADCTLIAAAPEMEVALEDARSGGLIYWEPTTRAGRIAKAQMLARIDAVLAKAARG